MDENLPLWKVTFARNYQSTKKHYHLHILARDVDEAILTASNWYKDSRVEGEEIEKPYIMKVKLVASFVVSPSPDSRRQDAGVSK